MGYFQSGFERVTLEFRGSIAGTFLRLLIQWVFSLLVLPTAWGIAILNRWLVKWVRFSDGTTATFVGRPVQVWGWIALSVGMYHIPNLVLCLISGSNPIAFIIDPQVRQDALARAQARRLELSMRHRVLHSCRSLSTWNWWYIVGLLPASG